MCSASPDREMEAWIGKTSPLLRSPTTLPRVTHVARRRALGSVSLDEAAMRLARCRWQEAIERPADHLAGSDIEHPRCSGVEEHNPLAGVDGDDRVERRLHQAFEL
jgi:hypothetical protein